MLIGYCPYCGNTLSLSAIANESGNLIWKHCIRPFCRGGKSEIITDDHGFVITPSDRVGYFIFKGKYVNG